MSDTEILIVLGLAYLATRKSEYTHSGDAAQMGPPETVGTASDGGVIVVYPDGSTASDAPGTQSASHYKRPLSDYTV